MLVQSICLSYRKRSLVHSVVDGRVLANLDDHLQHLSTLPSSRNFGAFTYQCSQQNHKWRAAATCLTKSRFSDRPNVHQGLLLFCVSALKRRRSGNKSQQLHTTLPVLERLNLVQHVCSLGGLEESFFPLQTMKTRTAKTESLQRNVSHLSQLDAARAFLWNKHSPPLPEKRCHTNSHDCLSNK